MVGYDSRAAVELVRDRGGHRLSGSSEMQAGWAMMDSEVRGALRNRA